MSLALRFPPKYTVADYERWEGDWELIEGMPYAMTPSPNLYHQRISGRLYAAFSSETNNCPNCETIYEIDWKVSEDTVIRPDLMIICDATDEEFQTTTPKLVIEILSPATAIKDRNLKFELLQREKVKYYLIVDPNTKLIEIYQIQQGAYKKLIELDKGDFEFDLDSCKIYVNFDKL